MARKLKAYVHVDGQVYGPGDEPPAKIAAQITNPDAWADGGKAEPEAADPYKGVSAAKLKAEIEKRNADREDDAKLSTEGDRADLVAVLVADDAADNGS